MAGRPEVPAVRMFGPLEVTLAHRTVGARGFGGIKPRQLLEVLLLERGRPVPKDHLADRVWGERLPVSAAATIETYVSQLRRIVGRQVIRTEAGGYRVPAAAVSTDLDAFDALVRRAAAASGEHRRAHLQAALDLAAGELLADEPYADWVLGPREHYRARRMQAQLELAECCLELGELDGALAVVGEVLAAEPTSERAHRAGMLAYHRRGDRAAALRQYARCRAELSDALGVAPSPQTAALHLTILRGGPAQDLPAAPVRYAESDGARIAYQVVGDGPVDLVFVPSFVTNLGATWDDPRYARFLRRLASMARLVLFDKRGTGLSDPVVNRPTPAERVADLRSVLDASGSRRAVLFGVCGGGAHCVWFAAEHPDRTAGVVLFGSAARIISTEDYPWGWTPEQHERLLAAFEEAWLTGGRPEKRNPGLADDPRYRDWFARYVRLAASPFTARQLAEANAAADLRELLPGLRTPCLVMARTEDVWLRPENSRYLAARIPGARLVELPGVDHDPWVGDIEPVLAAVREFLPVTAQHQTLRSASSAQRGLLARNT
jgi:DNA-binding SARP family transcriptional activator/pimeloyl-ACP methyl ester carboxylesterase